LVGLVVSLGVYLCPYSSNVFQFILQLSCYAEFNRMVQAIARSGGGGGITAFPAIRSMWVNHFHIV